MRRWLAFLFCRRGHWWSDPVGYSETRFCRVCGYSESGVKPVVVSFPFPFSDLCRDQYVGFNNAEPPKGGVTP